MNKEFINGIINKELTTKLKDFDPISAYPAYEGMPIVTEGRIKIEFSKTYSLITQMEIKGATKDEKTRCLRHLLVVFRAKEHNLNFRQSAKDFNIEELHNKYDPPRKSRYTIADVVNILKSNLEKHEYIDISYGVAGGILGVSQTKLSAAIAELKESGCTQYVVRGEQITFEGEEKKYKAIKVLGRPGSVYPRDLSLIGVIQV